MKQHTDLNFKKVKMSAFSSLWQENNKKQTLARIKS